MKRIISILALASLLSAVSCELDLYPVTGYHEGNMTETEEDGGESSQLNTTEKIKSAVKNMYESQIRGIQEAGYLDWLVYSECRADNAYCGSPGTGEISALEANGQDGENKNVVRDWNYFQQQVSNANLIICNVDYVKENDVKNPLSELDYQQIKAQALCWRAYNLFTMSQLWGDIPCVTVVPPTISSSNLEEVYHLYYPTRMPKNDVYTQIIEDLTYAAEYAPDPNPADGGNKCLLSKAFAHGMLARVYAEEQRRDWTKVKEHCEALEVYDFKLCPEYGKLWSYTETDATRNTEESIFEVHFENNGAAGNWVNWMFYRDAYDLGGNYSWAKWITPSRDLIAAYEKEGDTARLNASVATDECTWSTYYPMGEYKFMKKCPTKASSIILMRLGEIYLLHAEALAKTGDLKGATDYVNRIRRRAGIDEIDQPSDEAAMIDAILEERRLELSFEGFRFFDLVRHGLDRAKAVHDDIATRTGDTYWQTRYPLTAQSILLPIPQEALENNPSLVQNEGY